MGSVSQPKLLPLLSHLAFLLVTSSSSLQLTLPHPVAEPPSLHHHHHHHSPLPSPTYPPLKPLIPPPIKPPVHPHPSYPPLKPPVHPPSYPPLLPPSRLPRKAVAVEGVVYCKNCSYFGVDTLVDAKPLPGARVVLKCKNTVYTTKKTATADRNGYFFLEAPKTVTSYGARKCRVYLAEAPRGATCSNLTDLNGGLSGAALILEPRDAGAAAPLPYAIFNVGPFAFEPPKRVCLKH